MRVNPTNAVTYRSIPKLAVKTLNRANLSAIKSKLPALAGPAEKSEAEGWLVAYTVGNAGIAAAMAQMPGLDEAALAGVEVIMASHIFNDIYDFKFSDTMLKSLAAGVAGHAIGKTTFKLASKAFTWIPGIGNALNAVVSGTTTAALGKALISMAENMDAARKRGEKLDKFIKKMEE